MERVKLWRPRWDECVALKLIEADKPMRVISFRRGRKVGLTARDIDLIRKELQTIELSEHRSVGPGTFDTMARAYALKHIWRVRKRLPHMDVDDLYQELALKFVHLVERYPDASRGHFIALCGRAFSNRCTDLACSGYRRNNGREEPESNRNVDIDSIDSILGFHDLGLAEAELRVLLDDAPEPVRRIVDEAVLARPRRRRDTAYQRLSQLLHASLRRDGICLWQRRLTETELVGMVQKWLSIQPGSVV